MCKRLYGVWFRLKKLETDQLVLACKAIDSMNEDLVKIMNKLGVDSRYTYLHDDVIDMKNKILKELGERTLNESVK